MSAEEKLPDGQWRWAMLKRDGKTIPDWHLTDDSGPAPNTFCAQQAETEDQHELGEFIPVHRCSNCVKLGASLIGISI